MSDNSIVFDSIITLTHHTLFILHQETSSQFLQNWQMTRDLLPTENRQEWLAYKMSNQVVSMKLQSNEEFLVVVVVVGNIYSLVANEKLETVALKVYLHQNHVPR